MPGVKKQKAFQSEIASYIFEQNGILVSRSNSVRKTVSNIRSNVSIIKRVCGKYPMPLLLYLSPSPMSDKETRDFTAEQAPKVYKAVAMMSNSLLPRIFLKLFFSLKKQTVPTRIFSDEKKARKWLSSFL